jgi:hypothetical protein
MDEFREIFPGCGGDECLDTLDDEGHRVAVCTGSGKPDPRCPADRQGPICVGEHELIWCDNGYGWNAKTCEGLCVQDGRAGFCSLQTQPAPQCAEGDGPACLEGAVLECRKGYVTDEIVCDSGQRCMLAENPSSFAPLHAYCTTSESCEGESVRCTSETEMDGCIDGSRVRLQCNPGFQCDAITVLETGDVRAYCEEVNR